MRRGSRHNGKAGVFILLVAAAGALLALYLFWPPHDHPTAAPEQHDLTVPGGSVAPSGEQSGFREIARQAGIDFHMNFLPAEQGEQFKINLYDHGCGIVIGDYDGDGHEDLYFLNQLGSNALYKNKGDGTFENTTEISGVALDDRISVAATFADYDNDGRQDLYVTSTRGGNVLFHNVGDGIFEDVTDHAGLTCVKHSQTASFWDYDNDGYLDLFLTNTAHWTLPAFDSASRYYPGVSELYELGSSPKEHNILYHNNRDGTFTDVTAEAGLEGKGWGGDVAVFDYDEDGYLDLFVTNMFGRSQLYHNNRGATFTDVTEEVLTRTSWGAIGSKVLDFNNDGLFDLYVVDMHSDMWMPFDYDSGMIQQNRKYTFVSGPTADGALEQRFADRFDIRYPEVVFGNTLFQNLGNGAFAEVSAAANLETFWPWGIAAADFNNDGYEDIYLPSGMGYPWFYWPSTLFMNDGNGAFADRAKELGIEPPPGGRYSTDAIRGKSAARSSRCAAVADLDNDGKVDLVVNNFNDQPFYYQNNFPENHYLSLRLNGTKSNRDAIGAVVRVYGDDFVMARQVQPAGGYLSQSSRTLHFGLGDRTGIDRVEIRWPSGTKQVLTNLTLDAKHEINEPE